MARYYVTTEFVVEAEDAERAELLVARRVQEFLNQAQVSNARIVIEAVPSTEDETLRSSAPMLTEQTGYVQVPGGKPIPGDGTETA